MAKKKADKFVACAVKELGDDLQVEAAKTAIEKNPANRPALGMFGQLVNWIWQDDVKKVINEALEDDVLPPAAIAVLTTKYWGTKGVKLGVSFMDETRQDLADKIIAHMNAWNQWANIQFMYSKSNGEVRISRGSGGYWSYLGTDVLHIGKNQPTMNLEGFTLNTPESEYKRVVRHETGHSLGCPHEHMRKQIVARLDPQKTIDYFLRFQGWSAQTTRQQVLTPVSDSSIMGTPDAEEDSIMCYQLPGSITQDGKPVVGGSDITKDDGEFMAKMYPKELVVVPPTGDGLGVVKIDLDKKVVVVPQGWKLG